MENKALTVVVASKNPVKINAASDGLERMFPGLQFSIIPVSVPSGVSDQPMTDEETLRGALYRVNNAYQVESGADLWIGLEGGVEPMHGELAAFAWIVVRSRKMLGKARSGAFFLPRAVTALVEQGTELGTANDMIFSSSNSKQKGGAVGILTGNALDRKELYEQAVMLALVPFKNEELYTSSYS